MRCRTHPSDHGSGVCPCCLRERLSALTVAPAENKANPSPAIPISRSDFPNVSDEQQNHCVKFSQNPNPKKAESDAIVLKPSGSNSNFLALILGQWKKNKKKSIHIAPDAGDVYRGRSRKPHVQPVDGRGMSPAMKDETDKDERRIISTPSPLKRKPLRTQSPNKLSSYAVCLSPMLRPSPGNRRNHGASEAVFASDLQGGALNRKWSGVGVAVPDAASGQGLNRSRKLVDLGKAW